MGTTTVTTRWCDGCGLDLAKGEGQTVVLRVNPSWDGAGKLVAVDRQIDKLLCRVCSKIEQRRFDGYNHSRGQTMAEALA